MSLETKKDLIRLAQGLAEGMTTQRLAEAVGENRIVLRGLLEGRRSDLMQRAAEALGRPSALGEGRLASLFSASLLPGERIDNVHIRRKFADVLRAAYPEWFKRREAQERRKASKAEAEARRLERREVREEEAKAKREAALEECRRADFWNLYTVALKQRREWEDGTPDELRRGLSKPAEREAWRREHGITWSCAGFGVYYAKKWSACRCRLEYASHGKSEAWLSAPGFEQAWAEMEAEQSEAVAEEYLQNPLARRDKSLPTTEAEARAANDGQTAGK